VWELELVEDEVLGQEQVKELGLVEDQEQVKEMELVQVKEMGLVEAQEQELV
jgi:hypothetical protein